MCFFGMKGDIADSGTGKGRNKDSPGAGRGGKRKGEKRRRGITKALRVADNRGK